MEMKLDVTLVNGAGKEISEDVLFAAIQDKLFETTIEDDSGVIWSFFRVAKAD